jgi:hypothetical protein
MTDSREPDDLVRLQAHLGRSLGAFLRRDGFAVPRAGAARASPGARPSATDSRRAGRPGPVLGADHFLGDERQVRALAKEIKRLIIEDGRRGVGV